jgi:predicted Zn-dependent protease
MPKSLYERWMTAKDLLASGDAHAASLLLERIRDEEPHKPSVREALGRAYFISGRHGLAEREFAALLELDPVSDYAHYALARCALKRGDERRARMHIKLARIMNPSNKDYAETQRHLDRRFGKKTDSFRSAAAERETSKEASRETSKVRELGRAESADEIDEVVSDSSDPSDSA